MFIGAEPNKSLVFGSRVSTTGQTTSMNVAPSRKVVETRDTNPHQQEVSYFQKFQNFKKTKKKLTWKFNIT